VKGLICGFLAATASGILICVIKVMMMVNNISVFELIYQRSMTALVMVSIIVYWNRVQVFGIDRQIFKYILVRVLGSALAFFLQILAVQLIPISKVIVIMYNPFITTILSYLLIQEPVTKFDLISFFFCTLGVIMLTNPFTESNFDLKEMIGLGLAFTASISINVSFVALRRIRHCNINSWVVVFFIMLTNCMMMPAFFLSYDIYES
jgi:drug/metabolite transporter (DMT)-like permease